MNILFRFLERYSIFFPIFIAYLIGLLTCQPIGYFIVFFFLSFTPALLGMPDPVGEFIEFIYKEKLRAEENKHNKLILKKYGNKLLHKIDTFPPEALRLILECINSKTNGFNIKKEDKLVEILLKSKFIYLPVGYTPTGYPYYFHKRIWILINMLKYEILSKYNNLSKSPMNLRKDIKFKYTFKTFILSILLGILRLIALFIIGISFGSVTWIVWVFLMAIIVYTIVWSGNYIKVFFGI